MSIIPEKKERKGKWRKDGKKGGRKEGRNEGEKKEGGNREGK